MRALWTAGGALLAVAALFCSFEDPVGPAHRFTVVQQPTDTQAGATISPAVTVRAVDEDGNTATDFTGDVTIAIGTNPGGGALSGTTTVAAVDGVATFADLSIDQAGTGYTLVAGGLTAATSDPFDITPKPAVGLAFVQQTTVSAATGTPAASFPSTPRVGNLLVAVLGSVHDDVVGVTPGWTRRVAPGDTTAPPLYIYERIADGTETGIAFELTSPDATQIALFEFAGRLLADAQAQNSTGGRQINDANSISTGTAQNTVGTAALAVIHHNAGMRDGGDEPIEGWTNGFEEIADFGCCGTPRSRLAVAVRGLDGPGGMETSASWTTPSAASAAIVTYGP